MWPQNLSLALYPSSLKLYFAYYPAATLVRWLYNFSSKQRCFGEGKKALLRSTLRLKRDCPQQTGAYGHPTHWSSLLSILGLCQTPLQLYACWFTSPKCPSAPYSLNHPLFILQGSPQVTPSATGPHSTLNSFLLTLPSMFHSKIISINFDLCLSLPLDHRHRPWLSNLSLYLFSSS